MGMGGKVAAALEEGVLQVLVGKGSVVGTRLVEHPDVAKVAHEAHAALVAARAKLAAATA